MTYMVTYKTSEYFSPKISEYFSYILVEADDEMSAENKFKLLKPNCELIGIRDYS